MASDFRYISDDAVSSYRTLVHSDLYASGLKHGFITNELDLKSPDLCVPIYIQGIGKISLARQVHGRSILNYSEFGQEGDAFLVREGEVCGIRTADCVPLILIDKARKIGAVIHAGWQGACIGVLEATLDELVRQGLEKSEITALIGPSADLCCYEVREDVAEKFEKGCHFRQGKIYLSIPEYLEGILVQAGIQKANIFKSGICTICDNNYFSYRKNGESAGRFLTFLKL